MLFVELVAPFARFAPGCQGYSRPTLPMMPFSAAAGLLCNLVGIDLRTVAEPNWPQMRLAIGVPRRSPLRRGALLHHLHVVPQDRDTLERGRVRAQGTKPHIAPGRVQYLIGLHAIVAVETESGLLTQLGRELRGELPGQDIPFAGDSNLLFDKIVPHAEPQARWHWYARFPAGIEAPRGSCRLPIYIDRKDNSRSTFALVAPSCKATTEPPTAAWIDWPHG